MAVTNFYTRKLATRRAILAPMAGYTDAPFRKLCREFGSAWAVTEMVSAKALVVGDMQGIEIGEPYKNEPDVVIQVFGGEADITAAGGRILYEQYAPQALDLNMGCPVKKVTGKSCGSKLMLDPERAAEIVNALTKAVPVPVSAKMRLGYDQVNVLEVAQALEQAGAALIAVHGRTAAQKYSGNANWEMIAEVAGAVNIPVVGSGDVQNKAQFDAYTELGLGVMVARGAVGRPWIFAEFQGEDAPSVRQRAEIFLRHAVMNAAWYGEHKGMLPMRSQGLQYFKDMPNFAAMRKDIVRLASLEDAQVLLRKWLELDLPLPEAEVARDIPSKLTKRAA